MKCQRCGGWTYRDADGDRCCLMCGWVYVPPDEVALNAELAQWHARSTSSNPEKRKAWLEQRGYRRLHLTPSQEKVLKLLDEGKTIEEIARWLNLNEKTVKNHARYGRNRLEAAPS